MRALFLLVLLGTVEACSAAPRKGFVPEDDSDSGASPDGGRVLPDGAVLPPEDARPPPDAGPPLRISVSGNQLIDSSGATVRLLGVNHSGSEYRCVQGFSIFDGPSDDAMIAAMASWHVNAVRMGLNEDCWLGINGVSESYSGKAYRAAIADFVARLHAAGLYVILELHWSAPGTASAMGQQPMADVDHSLDFWKSVAQDFIADPAVLFDLYNEPYIDTSNAQTTDPWTCWRDGCMIKSGTWAAAGMQSLIDAVRSTGSQNVVIAGGLAYANDLSGWLTHKPNDPQNQLAASFHLYNFNTCKSQSCWDAQILPVSQSVPLITGEVGEDDCGHSFIDSYMPWADGRGASYLGWTWNPWDCKKGPALVTDFTGTPTAFGQGFRDHVMTLR